MVPLKVAAVVLRHDSNVLVHGAKGGFAHASVVRLQKVDVGAVGELLRLAVFVFHIGEFEVGVIEHPKRLLARAARFGKLRQNFLDFARPRVGALAFERLEIILVKF